MALTEEKEVEGDMAVPACFAGNRREQGTRRGQVGQDFSFGFFLIEWESTGFARLHLIEG